MSAYRHSHHGRGASQFLTLFSDNFNRAEIPQGSPGYYLGGQYAYTSSNSVAAQNVFRIINNALAIARNATSGFYVCAPVGLVTTFTDQFVQCDLPTATDQQGTGVFMLAPETLPAAGSLSTNGLKGVYFSLYQTGQLFLSFIDNSYNATSYYVTIGSSTVRVWKGVNGNWNVASSVNGAWSTNRANIPEPPNMPTTRGVAFQYTSSGGNTNPFLDNFAYGKAGV